MSESWQVYRDCIDAIGAKKVASALELSLARVYDLAKPIEADGGRSDIDRIEQLVDVLAAHQADRTARVALIRMRSHLDGFFRRTVDRDVPEPLTDSRIAEIAGHICEEVGELLQTMKPGIDRQDATREASEVIDAVQRFMKALSMPACNLKSPLKVS